MVGGRSKSESRSSSVVDTTNINLQDVEGLTFAGNSGGVVVELSDQGAIDAATSIAEQGFGAFSENIGLTRDILEASVMNSETVAGLAGSVLARESQNTDPRLEAITKTALLAAAAVVAFVLFAR